MSEVSTAALAYGQEVFSVIPILAGEKNLW